jgi:hypothetical protein
VLANADAFGPKAGQAPAGNGPKPPGGVAAARPAKPETPQANGGGRLAMPEAPQANGGGRAAAQPAPAATSSGGQTPASADPAAEVTVVPGIARYHRSDCILIRFLGVADLETMTRSDAEQAGCAPCKACRPEQNLPAE